ncbi:MAG: hypothetical protein RL329_1452 [Bacteroidota bacterium]|jgi:IS605 OrfB family transposase
MLTLKLKVKNSPPVSDFCKNYSFLYRKLYANFELFKDENFKKGLQTKYHLDSWFYESCGIEVQTKLAQEKTHQEKQANQIQRIENELSETKTEGRKGNRKTFRLHRTMAYLKSRQGKRITFGGLNTLRRISFLSNDSAPNKAEIAQLKTTYQEQRVLPIYSVGEAPQKSNRKFKFDFENQKMIFKPNAATQIKIEFYASKKQQKTLNQLQTRLGALPISVRLSESFVWVTYDEEKLAGYEFKTNDYKKEAKKLDRTDNEGRKILFQQYLADQKRRKLANKIENRFLAVDLNPEHIGFCVVEPQADSSQKVLHKGVLDCSNLNTRMGLSSTDPDQVAQNHKRRFELCELWKYLFRLATHYKVATFVGEDLAFKPETVNEKASEANRKTQNLWHRELTQKLIQKYCNTFGIENVSVIPAYSSFIGNIQHADYDPISASLEIARRGIVKYTKGSSIFPPLLSQDVDTMYQLGLDVPRDSVGNWKQAFGLFAASGLRYRRALDPTTVLDNYLFSYKSCIKLYTIV